MTTPDSRRVFFGHASNAEARVYAQWTPAFASHSHAISGGPAEESLPTLAEVTLAGTISGPRSKFARTLAATIPFRPLSAGEFPLAEAIVPDPCFWTPESPYTYQVEVVATRGGQVLCQSRQSLGIRPLGTRGKSVFFDGRRWVLRGAGLAGGQEPELLDWREEHLAMVCDDSPPSERLAAASELGVFVVARVTAEESDPLEKLAALSRWPAVGMVWIEAPVDESLLVAQRPRNVMLAQRLECDDCAPAFQPAPWADCLVGDATDDPATFAASTSHLTLPVIASRRVSVTSGAGPAALRAECERLQADLAPWGDYAGYLVESVKNA